VCVATHVGRQALARIVYANSHVWLTRAPHSPLHRQQPLVANMPSTNQNKPQLTWLEKYPVLSEHDIPGLEASAAAHEFKHGKGREEAEKAAHNEYLKGHAVSAMAHHLMGSKLALSAGNEEAALEHGKKYELAAKQAGYGTDKVPEEVSKILKSGELKKIYSHKAHKSDVLFEPNEVIEQGDKGRPTDKDSKDNSPHLDNSKVRQVLEGLERLKGILN
jgi:hypothetical protein